MKSFKQFMAQEIAAQHDEMELYGQSLARLRADKAEFRRLYGAYWEGKLPEFLQLLDRFDMSSRTILILEKLKKFDVKVQSIQCDMDILERIEGHTPYAFLVPEVTMCGTVTVTDREQEFTIIETKIEFKVKFEDHFVKPFQFVDLLRLREINNSDISKSTNRHLQRLSRYQQFSGVDREGNWSGDAMQALGILKQFVPSKATSTAKALDEIEVTARPFSVQWKTAKIRAFRGMPARWNDSQVRIVSTVLFTGLIERLGKSPLEIEYSYYDSPTSTQAGQRKLRVGSSRMYGFGQGLTELKKVLK